MSISSQSNGSLESISQKRSLKKISERNDKCDAIDASSLTYSDYVPKEQRNQEFNIKLEMLRGSRRSICQTENELKANKLNRTEECMLESTKSRVRRESDLFERGYKQSMHQFRVRSARMFKDRVTFQSSNDNIRTPKFNRSISAFDIPKSRGRLLNRRLNSEPSSISNCYTCDRVQGVVDAYEDEVYRDLEIGEKSHHTVCLFTDRQIKNFMHILETEYSSKLPKVGEMLQNSKTLFLTKNNNSSGNYNQRSSKSLDHTSIQQKIKHFCKKQEEFNKLHPIPMSIKQRADDARTTHLRKMHRRKSLTVADDN